MEIIRDLANVTDYLWGPLSEVDTLTMDVITKRSLGSVETPDNALTVTVDKRVLVRNYSICFANA